MKRFVCILLVMGLIGLLLAGCGAPREASQGETGSDPPNTSTDAEAAAIPQNSTDFADGTWQYDKGGFTCSIPNAWIKRNIDKPTDYFFPPIEGGLAFLTIDCMNMGIPDSLQNEEDLSYITDMLKEQFQSSVTTKCQVETNDKGMQYTSVHTQGEQFSIVGWYYFSIFVTKEKTLTVIMFAQDSCEKKYFDDYLAVVNSVEMRDAQREMPPSEAPVYAEAGRENALAEAKIYTTLVGYPPEGLMAMLQNQGFTAEEAAYGVENCGADWDEQAAIRAKVYKNYEIYLESELIDLLMKAGFTKEQAVYGASSIWD